MREKPLYQKLGIKPGSRVIAVDAPAHYQRLLGGLPTGATVTAGLQTPADVVHVFVRERDVLTARIQALKAATRQEGALWVSWPKRSAKLAADLDENAVREIALAAGLVDVKVVSVDPTWSALKLVRRLQDRT